jgi:hypothetical protein
MVLSQLPFFDKRLQLITLCDQDGNDGSGRFHGFNILQILRSPRFFHMLLHYIDGIA